MAGTKRGKQYEQKIGSEKYKRKLATYRKWYKTSKKAKKWHRERQLQKRGLSTTAFEALLLRQGGVCAICKQPSPIKNRRLAVDHDHKTDTVRGLLCQPCNVGLGCFFDDPLRLQAAMHYLQSASALRALLT